MVRRILPGHPMTNLEILIFFHWMLSIGLLVFTITIGIVGLAPYAYHPNDLSVPYVLAIFLSGLVSTPAIASLPSSSRTKSYSMAW